MSRFTFIFCLSLISSLTANAQYLEFSATHDDLNNGYAPWDDQWISAEFKARHSHWNVQYRQTNRYDLTDQQVRLSGTRSLSRWDNTLSLDYSHSHRVLPELTFAWRGSTSLHDGIVTSTMVTRSIYTNSVTDQAALGAEIYSGPLLFITSFSTGLVQDAGPIYAGSITSRLYFNENTFIALGVSSGQEVERINSRNILTMKTRATHLDFMLRPLKQTEVFCSFSYHQQGELYAKRGATISLRHHL